MRTLSKRVAAAAVTAAFAGAMFAPSIALAGPTDPVTDCAAQVGALQETVTSLTTALPLPLSPGEAQDLPGLPTGDPMAIVGQIQTQVTGLVSSGCLPAVPPADGVAVDQCTDLTADLLANVSATLAAVVSVGAPDPTVVISAATNLTTTLTSLISASCLPAAPVPV